MAARTCCEQQAEEPTIHFLFPSDPLNPRSREEYFAQQMTALSEAGFSVSLLPDSSLAGGTPLKGIPAGAQVVYRGWMLRPEEYGRLTAAVEAAGGVPFIPPSEYLAAHYLPNWYPLVRELTPETRCYPEGADLVRELKALRWDGFFVKDYVKALKTSVGSLIRDPEHITVVLEQMRKYRGEIEGGVCVRRVEDWHAGSERRYFVLNGRAYGSEPSESIPDVVLACAERIPSQFFSVDVAIRRDGMRRIVEIGDGQVSDRVGWSAAAFVEMWIRERGGAAAGG